LYFFNVSSSLDFNQDLWPGEIRYLDCGPAGSGFRKKGIVDFVVGIKIGHILQEDSDIDEVPEVSVI